MSFDSGAVEEYFIRIRNNTLWNDDIRAKNIFKASIQKILSHLNEDLSFNEFENKSKNEIDTINKYASRNSKNWNINLYQYNSFENDSTIGFIDLEFIKDNVANVDDNVLSIFHRTKSLPLSELKWILHKGYHSTGNRRLISIMDKVNIYVNTHPNKDEISDRSLGLSINDNNILLVYMEIVNGNAVDKNRYKEILSELLNEIDSKNEDEDESMKYLPINVYIIDNMDMNVQGVEMKSWIDSDDVEDVFEEINTLFFNKVGIEWKINEINIYAAPEDSQLDYISELTRDTDKYPDIKRMEAYTSLIPERKYSKEFNNIYFTTYNI